MRATIFIVFLCGMIQGAVYSKAWKYQESKNRIEYILSLHREGMLSSAAYLDMNIETLNELAI